jgi:PAS domain S-box-containing protein
MQSRKFFRVVRPFVTALALIATVAILVFAIYFTLLSLQWIAFLAGVLVAAILAEATRASHSEWVVLRRTVQLAALKERLDLEMRLRKRAEEEIAANKLRLHLIDDELPTMVAFIDIEGRCQYHNQALLNWLNLKAEQVFGRHIRELLGAKVYQENATSIRQSLDGHAAHYDRTEKLPNGTIYHLSVQHLPQFDKDGKVTGFFMLINDITSPSDIQVTQLLKFQGSNQVNRDGKMPASDQDGKNNQASFNDSATEQDNSHEDADRILAAIENGDFRLFCQLITPLAAGSKESEHYEILVRLIEEEENMLPPGAFFPLAEKYGLMSQLDRWVVQHVTEWASRQDSPNDKRNTAMYFINVSDATIGDPGFPEFLQLTLLEYGVPGSTLCFEIPDSELALKTSLVAEFASRIKQCGCLIAISGFGRDRIMLEMISSSQVDFLKIDGSLIFDVLRNPDALDKIIAISQMSIKNGVRTVAELVESEETIVKLREIGIDFAQGFGISRPRPLAE